MIVALAIIGGIGVIALVAASAFYLFILSLKSWN